MPTIRLVMNTGTSFSMLLKSKACPSACSGEAKPSWRAAISLITIGTESASLSIVGSNNLPLVLTLEFDNALNTGQSTI